MDKPDQERQRKLTKAEAMRKERFEATKEQLEVAGYQTVDLTIGLVYANVMAFVLGLPIIILFSICFFLQNQAVSVAFQGLGVLWFFLVLIVLIPIHELIHGLSWAMFAKSRWRAISFGFIARYLTPYCTCEEPLQKRQYIIGAAMPTVFLGFLPALIGIFSGSVLLFQTGAVMILCGGGDLAIILKVLRFNSQTKDTIYMDHPYQTGLVAFVRK